MVEARRSMVSDGIDCSSEAQSGVPARPLSVRSSSTTMHLARDFLPLVTSLRHFTLPGVTFAATARRRDRTASPPASSSAAVVTGASHSFVMGL